MPYPPLTPEQQAEIQRKNAAIRAREAEDNRLPDPTDDDLSTDPFQIRGPVRTKAQEREAEAKSIVPNWLMPTLTWIQRNVNDPLDHMGQAGGKIIGDMLEGGAAAILEGKGGYAEPGEAVDPESGLPLPRPEDYSPERVEEFRKDHPAAAGTLRGIGGVVGGTVADPRNWPFFFSGGLSSAAQRALSAGFTVQVARNAYEAADQVERIWDDPNIPLDQKYEAITNSVLSALMAGTSASHTMRTEGPPLLESRLVEQLDRMGEQAKQEIFRRLQSKIDQNSHPADISQAGVTQFVPGDYVRLAGGNYGTVVALIPKIGAVRVKLKNGDVRTVRLSEVERRAKPRNRVPTGSKNQLPLLPAEDRLGTSAGVKTRKNRMPTTSNKNLDHSRTTKHPDGSVTYYDHQGRSVTYSKEGFPDFSQYAKKQCKVKDLTGRSSDADLANREIGLESTPEGYVWHHVEDGETMELIPKDIHNNFPHTGGGAPKRSGGKSNVRRNNP